MAERSALEKRLADAIAVKEQGNAYLKEGLFKKASFAYKSVHLHIGDLIDLPPAHASPNNDQENDRFVQSFGRKRQPIDVDLQRRINEVYLATQNNLALAHLKLGRNAEAAQCASTVLRALPDNTKGLYRRARARMCLGMLDEAEADLDVLLRLVPMDPDGLAAREMLERLRYEAAVKEKKMFQKMFV